MFNTGPYQSYYNDWFIDWNSTCVLPHPASMNRSSSGDIPRRDPLLKDVSPARINSHCITTHHTRPVRESLPRLSQ